MSSPQTRPGTLVLLRHGESEWNKANLFTGWVDVPLSEKGRGEAARGGELLAEHGLLPDVAHTSVLKRAITTAELALTAADRQWIPVKRSWRLNERHYGALQGKDKAATLAEYGEEQFTIWRRSYSTPPPPIEAGSEYSQDGDARYAMLPPEVRPQTECLARSEEHTSELQSRQYLVCRLLLEKKKKILILHITNFSHLRPFYLSFTI